MEQVKKNEISFARFEPKVLRHIHVAKKMMIRIHSKEQQQKNVFKVERERERERCETDWK
jgi:hypothetical protein